MKPTKPLKCLFHYILDTLLDCINKTQSIILFLSEPWNVLLIRDKNRLDFFSRRYIREESLTVCSPNVRASCSILWLPTAVQYSISSFTWETKRFPVSNKRENLSYNILIPFSHQLIIIIIIIITPVWYIWHSCTERTDFVVVTKVLWLCCT